MGFFWEVTDSDDEVVIQIRFLFANPETGIYRSYWYIPITWIFILLFMLSYVLSDFFFKNLSQTLGGFMVFILWLMLFIIYYLEPYGVLKRSLKEGREMTFHYPLYWNPSVKLIKKPGSMGVEKTVKKPGEKGYRIPTFWISAYKIVIKKK